MHRRRQKVGKDMNERTISLIGEEKFNKLSASRVAVFGLGGVGSFVVEALARAGVGSLDFIDDDTVHLSNVNRQLFALQSTVGKRKTAVAKARVQDINPAIKVETHDLFVLPETVDEIDFSLYDYVVDAIDTVSGKIAIIEKANRAGVPVISCMGTGNKLDATAFEIADIENTSVCPLARVMRRELKKRGVSHVKVVYSKETPIINAETKTVESGKPIPASISFVPSVAGLLLAGEVIKDLTK